MLIAVITILFAFHGSHEPSTSDAASNRRLVRLTSTSGLSTDPTLSPDGTLLAYASDRSADNFDIYVQPVAGGDPVRITNDPADESEPSFAPDGAHIVFSRRGAGLYVVGALGGEPRLIVRTPWARTPRFSPDGHWISYWTGFPASVVAGGIPGALGSIFIVPPDGGSPRQILTHLASARYPIWSPDGEHILFLGEEDADQKRHDWYVIPRNGDMAIKTGVVEALRAAGLRAPFPIPGSWSARNNTVVFATNEIDNSNIWQIRISPSTSRVIGPPERLTFGTAIERNPIVANSGRIAFASILENVDIWRVPLDTKTGEATGALERITNDASDRLRSVSSDGRTLFLISSRTNRDEVWTKDLQTGQERQLTYSGVEEASASPDGSRVAFSRNEAGKCHIEIAATADGLPSKLCDDCDRPAGWSRDGKRLLFAMSVPFRRLLQYDFTSNRQTELVTHPTWSLERPRFSPDGRWVTFHTANSPNVRQIYSAPVGMGEPIPQRLWVPVVMDHGCHPSWSPDGALLYHFSFRDGAFCPWVQRVDRATNHPIGPARAVLHFHHPRLRAASGAAAFNDVKGGYLYMTLTQSTGNIWMIDSTASPRDSRAE
jgi:Tol biopolymer transport system component